MKRNAVARLIAMTCSILLILSGVLVVPAQAARKPKLTTPTSSHSSKTYTGTQTVTLSGPAGATIYYTTNGKTPTVRSAKYTMPLSISKTTTIKAIAVKSGYANSAVKTVRLTIKLPKLAMPKASHSSKTYVGTQTVTLTAPAGATIRYTLNGRTPTAKSTKYTKPLVISKNTTIKAIAVRNGYTNSAVMTVKLKIKSQVPDPGNAYLPANKTFPLSGGSITIKAPAKTTVYIRVNTGLDDSNVSMKNYQIRLTAGKSKTLHLKFDMELQYLLVRSGYADRVVIRKYILRQSNVTVMSDEYRYKVLDGVNWSRYNSKLTLSDGTTVTHTGPAKMDSRLYQIAQAHAERLANEEHLYHTGYNINESVCYDNNPPYGIGVQSATHCPNLESPDTTLIGVGAAMARNGNVYVVVEGGSEEQVAALAKKLGITTK